MFTCPLKGYHKNDSNTSILKSKQYNTHPLVCCLFSECIQPCESLNTLHVTSSIFISWCIYLFIHLMLPNVLSMEDTGHFNQRRVYRLSHIEGFLLALLLNNTLEYRQAVCLRMFCLRWETPVRGSLETLSVAKVIWLLLPCDYNICCSEVPCGDSTMYSESKVDVKEKLHFASLGTLGNFWR